MAKRSAGPTSTSSKTSTTPKRTRGATGGSTEVSVPESRELRVPGTGEIVSLDNPAAVGLALSAVREFKRHLDEARSILERELIAESARQGTKTLHFDTLTASIGADYEIEWDVTELVKLLDAGMSEERYGELVTEVITYKVDGNVARQISGANPEYARLIENAKNRKPKTPYVGVKEKGAP